jgi:hypothetical protein
MQKAHLKTQPFLERFLSILGSFGGSKKHQKMIKIALEANLGCFWDTLGIRDQFKADSGRYVDDLSRFLDDFWMLLGRCGDDLGTIFMHLITNLF